MKKINKFWAIMLLLFVVPMVFSSCNKDDDDNYSTNPSDLIGTWRIVKEYWKDKEDGESDTETYGDDDYFTIQFKEDDTYIIKEYEYDKLVDSEKGTYTAEKGVLILNGHDDWNYKISGKTLTIYYDDEDEYDENTFTRVN